MLFPLPLPSVEAALRDVRSKDARARARAAEALAGAEPPRREEALAALRPLVADDAGPVRFAAVAALGKLGDAGSLDEVLARFEDADRFVRQAAVIAAADIGDPRAAAALRNAITDGNPDVRFQAVVSYALLCPGEAVGPLVDALDDGDAEVRANAATALGDLLANASASDCARAHRALVRRLDDPAVPVCFEAALALATLGEQRAGPKLLAALDDGARAIDAATALGELRFEPARTKLAALAGRFFGTVEVRVAAAGALAQLGDARGPELLRKVLTGWRADGRAQAVDVVERLQLSELADVLVPLLDRPRGADPVVVARALGRLASQSPAARAALAAAAARPDEVGEAARQALAPRATTEPP